MIAARICMARMTVSVESQDTTEVRGAHVVSRGSYSRKGRLFPRPGSGREIGDRSGLNATPAGVGSSFENLLLAPARESFVDFHTEHSRGLPQVSRREQCRVLRIRPPTPRPAPNPSLEKLRTRTLCLLNSFSNSPRGYHSGPQYAVSR